MSKIQFLFIGEGPSASGLIPHIENLCIELGAEEVTGTVADFRRLPGLARTVEEKIKTAVKFEPNSNLVFIHRDADNRDSTPRYREIASAVEASAPLHACVAVVPVQETEAWLLLHEGNIRSVAGRPKGKVPLGLPSPFHVESVASPKECLKSALLLAAELTGRRRDRFKAEFPTHRQLLLERLPTGGALDRVHSWTRLRADITDAINRITTIEIVGAEASDACTTDN